MIFSPWAVQLEVAHLPRHVKTCQDRSFLFSSVVGSTWISNWQHRLSEMLRKLLFQWGKWWKNDGKWWWSINFGGISGPWNLWKRPMLSANFVPEILRATRHIWKYHCSHVVEYLRRNPYYWITIALHSYVKSAIASAVPELTSQLQVDHWVSLHVTSGYLILIPYLHVVRAHALFAEVQFLQILTKLL